MRETFFAVIGANGGGKSTLLKLILGLFLFRVVLDILGENFIGKISLKVGFFPNSILSDFPKGLRDHGAFWGQKPSFVFAHS